MKALFPAALALLLAACHHDPRGNPAHEVDGRAEIQDAPSRREAGPAPAPAAGRHAAAAMMALILRDNIAFATEHDHAYFDSFRDEQHPRATVVACADSRFHAQAIDSHPDGDLYVVRNIGNQVDASEGSVEYGIRHLHTPLLLIVGHVGCGAIKAAISDYGGEPPSIRRELDGLHLSLRRATAAPGAFDERWRLGVIDNVHQQVADALSEYGDLVRAGELSVVGAVYDFRGDLGGGPGVLHIVDIDGEKSPDGIAASPLLREARRLIPGGDAPH